MNREPGAAPTPPRAAAAASAPRKGPAPPDPKKQYRSRRIQEFFEALFGLIEFLVAVAMALSILASIGCFPIFIVVSIAGVFATLWILSRMPRWLALRKLGFRFRLLTFAFNYSPSASGGPPLPEFPRDELHLVPWEDKTVVADDIALIISAEHCWAQRFGEAYGDPDTPFGRVHRKPAR